MAGYARPVWWVLGTTPLTEAEREALCEWVRSLGLDPMRLGTTTAVVEFEGAYELHVDEILTDKDGNDRYDPFDERAFLVQRRILPVSEGSWPSAFGEKP